MKWDKDNVSEIGPFRFNITRTVSGFGWACWIGTSHFYSQSSGFCENKEQAKKDARIWADKKIKQMVSELNED